MTQRYQAKSLANDWWIVFDTETGREVGDMESKAEATARAARMNARERDYNEQ